jgi:hypothetical protein
MIAEQRAALVKMLDFARDRGFRMRLSMDQAVDLLSMAIDPQRSFTFRSGKIGDWRSHFSAEHIRLFKEVAGDLLIRLGYERDLNW